MEGDGNHISLSLTSAYASSWGTWEGVRELVQNWHDGLYETLANGDTSIQSGTVTIKHDVCWNKYVAQVKSPCGIGSVVLGELSYNHLTNRLIFINKNTSLQRKILLLGYSKKAEARHVIGHFGEGLKIGALALVRENRVVTMETSKDRWKFELLHNPEFGEKVLTIVVQDRTSEDSQMSSVAALGNEDTYTAVTLEHQEWEQLKSRFLFLSPPQDFVVTELGTLLLDDHLAGQLYVKGVWVANLSEDDLASGVNFATLPLDRDRNAVPRPSEIDHQISCMWLKAMELRPDLIEKYFNLLNGSSHFRDTKHALTYANEDIAVLIAEHFAKLHGGDVFAVDSSIAQKEMDAIRNELSKKIVICNQTLLKLLHMSGKHVRWEDALANHRSANRLVRAYQSLSEEESGVLKHAVAMVQLAEPSLTTSIIDIVQSTMQNGCSENDGRIEVPDWLFKKDMVHASSRLCPLDSSKCLCREVRLSFCLLLLRQNKMEPAQELNICTLPHHPLLYMLQPMALQVCNKAMPFCEKVHTAPPAEQGAKLHDECIARESTLLEQFESLKITIQEQAAQFKEKFESVKKQLEKRDKELVSTETKLIDVEMQMKDRYEAHLKKATQSLQAERTNLKLENANLKQDLAHWRSQLEQTKHKNRNVDEEIERKSENMMEELKFYVSQCCKRTKALKKVCEEKLKDEDNDPDIKEKLHLTVQLSQIIAEDLQKEKFFCSVCLRRRKEVLLQPCGHYQLCSDCAHQLHLGVAKCPTCRKHCTSVIKVYE